MEAVKTKTYIDYFWTLTDEPGVFKCSMCPKSRAQDTSAGYTNLVGHLEKYHPEYKKLYQDDMVKSKGQPMLKYLKKRASAKAVNIYKWIKWVIDDNLPFDFVESEKTRENTKLDPISAKTLKKYMFALQKKVRSKIEKTLKKHKRLGTTTDGWSFGVEHYLGMFATIVEDKDTLDFLMTCSVHEDIDDETEWAQDTEEDEKIFGLSAEDLFDHTCAVLVGDFSIDTDIGNFSEIIDFLGGDSTSVNRSLADRSGVAHAGCESHRLQIGVSDFWVLKRKKTGPA